MKLKDKSITRPKRSARSVADAITRGYNDFYRNNEQDMTVVHQMRATHRRIVERTENYCHNK